MLSTTNIAYAVNDLENFLHNPGIIHFRALIYLVGFIKSTSYTQLKYFSTHIDSLVYKLLISNDIKPTEESIITFTDSSWNDCIDIDMSTGGYIYIYIRLCKTKG